MRTKRILSSLLALGLSFTAAFSATACKKSSLSGDDLPRGFGFASE